MGRSPVSQCLRADVELKKWDFLVCRDPQLLEQELNKLVTAIPADAAHTPESVPISV